MNLAGVTFRAVANSENGSLNTQTEMRFTRDDGIVVASYDGGTIAVGHVLGKRLGEDELEMLYQGATTGRRRAGGDRARDVLPRRGRPGAHAPGLAMADRRRLLRSLRVGAGLIDSWMA